jgi:predicted AAA+ superfamily ATPase
MISNPKEWGRVVESSIGAHLINYGITERFNVFYWREGNSKIDFVIEKKKGLIGLEVKSGGAKVIPVVRLPEGLRARKSVYCR